MSSLLERYSSEAWAAVLKVPIADVTIDAAKPAKYAKEFAQVEEETGISRHFLAAIAWTESGFYANARNSIGATGLMQIMPMHFAEYGIAGNPFDPLGNIRAGAKDLKRKGYGTKPLLKVMQGYNGLVSVNDPVKLAAFMLYFNRICARWAHLATTRMV